MTEYQIQQLLSAIETFLTLMQRIAQALDTLAAAHDGTPPEPH